jgi:hypothetical protein
MRALTLRPIFGRQGLHGQRMDFLAHAIAQRLVYELMALHPGFSAEGFAHDHGLEVLTVADHFQMLALEMVFDIALYIVGSNQGVLLKELRKSDILAPLTIISAAACSRSAAF